MGFLLLREARRVFSVQLGQVHRRMGMFGARMFPSPGERELGIIAWLVAFAVTALLVGWLKMAELSCKTLMWLFPCSFS